MPDSAAWAWDARIWNILWEWRPGGPPPEVKREDGLTHGEWAFNDLSISRELIEASSRLVLSTKGPYEFGGFGESIFGTVSFQSPFNSWIAGIEGRRRTICHPRPRSKWSKCGDRRGIRHVIPTNTDWGGRRREACQDTTGRQPKGRRRMTEPPPPVESLSNATTTAQEVHAGPMVEKLSVNAIIEEGNSTTPPIRRCQQGEEAKIWTSVPLLQRISSSNE